MPEISEVVEELEKAVGVSTAKPGTGSLITVAESKAQVLSAYATLKIQEKSAKMLESYFQATAKAQADTLQELHEQVGQMEGQSTLMNEQIGHMKGQASLMSEQIEAMKAQSAQIGQQARNTRILTYGLLAVSLASLGLILVSVLHL